MRNKRVLIFMIFIMMMVAPSIAFGATELKLLFCPVS